LIKKEKEWEGTWERRKRASKRKEEEDAVKLRGGKKELVEEV